MTKRKRKADQPASGRRHTVTSKEIAREAGVSTATVSRVFNQPEKVRPATRELVLKIMKRHHYVSDGMAVALASRRSQMLGLIIPTITNSIYASCTQALKRIAQDAGYSVLIGISEYSVEHEDMLIHRLMERRIEGLILTGAERDPLLYEKIRHNNLPFVVTWQLVHDNEFPSVSFDNYKAARTAVEHLVSLGHRRIGLICGRTDVNDRARDRRRGYEAVLRKYGIDVDARLIFERDFEFVEGRAAMNRLLSIDPRPTAAFCANDIQAIGALYECRESGIRVPEDLSIIGFDDLPIAQYTWPQLTTIRVPASEMGRRAAESLLTALKTGQPPLSVELPTDLIIRGSTAAPQATKGRPQRARIPKSASV